MNEGDTAESELNNLYLVSPVGGKFNLDWQIDAFDSSIDLDQKYEIDYEEYSVSFSYSDFF